MPALTGFILILIFPVACVCGNVVIVAHNTTINLTCTISGRHAPDWYVNETYVVTNGDRYRASTSDGVGKTATLMINGNLTCETLNVYCEVYNTSEQRFVHMHNTTLRFQGRLPSPENVHTKEHFNSSIIEWKPPFSARNNVSETIYVDPHIIQYTVYINDSYTGNIIVKENVTGTQYTFNNKDDSLCPMCQVSAWNVGGEGEMSELAQENTSRVPRNVKVGSITVRGTVTTNVHIHISNVDVVCTSRIPEFFLITLMTSAGKAFNETRQHQPGQPVADFTISLPQDVDVCSLIVRISAGNSAGMSAPSGPVVVGCSGDSTDSTTTASATTVLTATSTGSGSEGNSQQGSSTTLIVTITIGVIAAVVIMLIVAVVIMCCFKHKSKNSKVKHSDQTDNYYTESPPLGGPVPLYKPPVAEAVYVTTEQTTSRPVVRDPEYTAVWMQTLDSVPSTRQTSVAMAPEIQTQTSYSPSSSPSTISGRSDDLLLPPSPPVPASRPNLVYTQVNVQQTQVPPPANDDHVQYAQLKQQDKM